MSNKHGVNIDEADEALRDAFDDEFGTGVVPTGWSYEELLRKYNHLKKVVEENFPGLWRGMEFSLSIKTILNIKDCTLPFAGILLGVAGSQKTLGIECFRDSYNTFYTDNFSPRSLVSHVSGKTEDQLKKSDLLPKLQNKFFLTPELAPIFSARDDDLLQLIGVMTRVLDGHGYENDTGAQGHRGYRYDIHFTWLGAVIDISPKVYKLLSTLGPKLYFHRQNRIEETEEVYYSRRNQDFESKKRKVKEALLEYLTYFDMNPDADILQNPDDPEDQTGLRKIALDPDNDEGLAHKIIIRMALILGRLRALVPTWETYGTQGSDYAYRIAQIEEPPRAIQQLTNLAKGHALSMGRRYITLEDIPIVVNTALSTASMERVEIFELLIAYHGTLDTTTICESLNVSDPTARRTMTELKATGLVSMKTGIGQTTSSITLDSKYDWFLSEDFAKLKEGKTEDLAERKIPPREGGLPLSENESNGNGEVKNETQILPLSGGKNSFYKMTDKPLDQWGSVDFVLNACIYCLNNGGYHGVPIETTEEYGRHIVHKHPGKPAYPGPADIELYGLKLPAAEPERPKE